MDADEREVYYYLKSYRTEFISSREISRRAGGKRRFRQDPNWVNPVLPRMTERGILETDNAAHYRIKPRPDGGKKKLKWVSPQVARILRDSGKDFSEVVKIDDQDGLDSYYESL